VKPHPANVGMLKQMRRRQAVKLFFVLSLLIGVALFALAAGGNTHAAAQKSGKKITIVYAATGGVDETVTGIIIRMFEKKYPNIHVVYDSTDDPAKMQEMVNSGNVTWNVVELLSDYGLVPSEYKYLTKLNCKLVPCSKVQPKRYPAGSPPHRINWSPAGEVLGYNTTMMPAGHVPKTWADFFNTKKFPGKRIALSPDVGGWVYEPALVGSGVSLKHVYPLKINRALNEWDKIKSVTTFTSSYQQCAEAVAHGDAAMGLCFSGRFYDVNHEGLPVKVSWKAALMDGTYLAIPKGAKNVKAAEKWISFFDQPRPQGIYANHFPYGPANLKAMRYIKKSIRPWLGVNHTKTSIIINPFWWGKHRVSASNAWHNWLTGG
jgi:putative spermidine/putrescine transport system substrate-binding protein